jgi:plasmid maintenance system killer protein
VIVSYRGKRTRDFATGKRVKAFSGFEPPARLKLDRMEAATPVGDLAALPGNGSRHCAATGRANTACASTINGGFALNGWMGRLDRLT